MQLPGFAPRQPIPTANTLHLNACLLYDTFESCVLDQTSKGSSDSRAKQICTGLRQAMGNNREQVMEGFSMNANNWWEDNEFIVVPVTLTSEGVHNGAYKSFNELRKGFTGVENLPITILHPPGRGVIGLNEVHGWVRESWFDPKNAAWRGNAYLIKDADTLTEMGHDEQSVKAHVAVCDAIRKGGRFDGSIGYWHGTINEGGNYNGAQYDRREVNILADHFAIVDRGASDWFQGTGFGNNDDKKVEATTTGHGTFIVTGTTATTSTAGNTTLTFTKTNWSGNANTTEYDSTYTGKGGPPRAQLFNGWTEEEDGHRHRFVLHRGHTIGGEETLLLEVAPSGGVADDHEGSHTHQWSSETSTSKDSGHAHKLPASVKEWLAAQRKHEEDDVTVKQRLTGKAPAENRFLNTISRFLFGGEKTKSSDGLANTLNQNKKSIEQGMPSMESKEQHAVVRALSLNTLASMNPDVKAMVDREAAVQQTVRDLTANAQRWQKEAQTAQGENATLKNRIAKYEEAEKKVSQNQRTALIRDIVSATREDPKVYAKADLASLTLTRNAVARSHGIDFTADAENSPGDVGKEEPSYDAGPGAIKPKGMQKTGNDHEDEDEEEDYEEDEAEELKVTLHDSEEADGYEDYLKPAAKVPAPGAGGRHDANRSDRSPLLARIQAARKAQAERGPRKPATNSAVVIGYDDNNTYSGIWASNQKRLAKARGDE